jgi:hypothetical protein
LLPFVEQRLLSDLWRRASRGSYIVDIRPLRGPFRVAVGEVCKYVSKGLAKGGDVREGVRAWVAVRGTKTHRPWGTLHGKVQRPPPLPAPPCRRCGAVAWFPLEFLDVWGRTALPVDARAPP